MNKLRISLIVLIFLAFAGSIFLLPVNKAEAKKKKSALAGAKVIGYSNTGRFSLALIAGEDYLRKFAEQKGWIFITAEAEQDTAKQAQDIDNLIARGVDLVMCNPTDSKAIISSIKASQAAGIPFVLYLRAEDPKGDAKADAYSGQDTVAQAYDAAIALSKIVAKNGVKAADVKVMHVIGDLRDQNAILRKQGFEQACKELGWKIVVEVPAEWDLNKALTGATNALQAHKDVNVVLIASDYLWPGVKTALQNQNMLKKAGEKGHVFIGSQDVFPIAVDDIKAGYIDASTVIDMGGMAVVAIAQAEKLMKGEKLTESTNPPKRSVLKATVITMDNVDTVPNLWGKEFHP